jgi:nucleotide-binding universal stress UspA family protein
MYDRILVPLKGDGTDEPVVAHTGGLARLSGGAVTLLRVIHSHSRDEATFLEEEAHSYLDGQVARLAAQGVKAEGRALWGEPGPTIIATARELHADLVIMATHGHHEIRHVLMGSVTEDVVREGVAAVLLVRPQHPAEAADD